jgi:ABC-type glycerol-3-phosphate transport system permease component
MGEAVAVARPDAGTSAGQARRLKQDLPRVGTDWRRVWRRAGAAARYATLIALGVVFAMPFVWMVGTSLMKPEDVLAVDRPLFPSDPQWSNYKEAMNAIAPLPVRIFGRDYVWPAFAVFLKNTLTIALLCVVGQTLSAAMVAFAFARLRFPFREPLFLLVLSTMMLPPQVTMIPQFILFARGLGWIDSLKPLIVPAFFGGGAFYIFLLRQFFLTIPKELEEAARLDGCGTFRIFWHVALPLSKPALTTVALFSFISHWNDFLGPLIYTMSMANKTLAVGLASFKSLHGTEYHLLMAASVVVLIPIVIIFFLAQRYFVEGAASSGVKG